jgi:hypothetical protein
LAHLIFSLGSPKGSLNLREAMSKPSDDKKRDEVLKRMLQTPHKPHVPVKKAKKATSKNAKEGHVKK